MRIALLCADGGVPLGGRKGCSIHLRSMADALLRARHAVTAVVAAAGPAEGCAPLLARGLELRVLRSPVTEAGIRGHLSSIQPDLVYERLALLAPEGARAAAAAGIRHLYEVNAPLDQEAAEHRGFLGGDEARTRFAEGFRASRGAVCVTDEVADWVRRLAPGSPVRVEPNGAGPEFLASPPAARVQQLRERLGLDPHAMHVGFVGSFRPWHDLGSLVGAVSRLKPRHHARLLLVGDGPTRNEVLREATELNVGVTLCGAVAHDDVPAYLALCDVVVVPYARRDDYFSPLKLLEAMAAGRPVVASATAPVRRLVRDGREVLLAEPGSASSLHAALERLAASPQRRAALGAAAQARIIAHHTWDAVASRILDWSATLETTGSDACGP